MPLNRIQDLIAINLDLLNSIRKLVLKRRNTTPELIEQLERTRDHVSWFKKKIELHRNHHSNSPKYVNRYEVFNCNFGYNIKQEINKTRPCVIIETYSQVAVIAPIRHGSMMNFDPVNRTIELPQNNAAPRIKRIASCMFPIQQDMSFKPAVCPKSWQNSNLNGCIDLGHIRTVSYSRFNKMPIGKLNDDNKKELDERLFDFLKIDLSNIKSHSILQKEYHLLKEKNYELNVKYHGLQKKLDELQANFEILQNEKINTTDQNIK